MWLILLLILTFNNLAEARLLKVLQLADLHIDREYLVGSSATCLRNEITYPCCRHLDIPVSPYRKAGVYGDYNCDSPYRLLNETLQYLSSTLKPDLILWTGDSPGHHDLTQSKIDNLADIVNLTCLIQNWYPSVPVFPVLGNHDTWPIDQMSLNQSWLLEPVAETWEYWIGSNYTEFLKGGFYSRTMFPGLRIIGLSTTFWDYYNTEFRGNDPLNQWEWLETELLTARKMSQKVWIVGHIYPGNVEARKNYSQTYIQLTSKYQDVITSHFFSHLHQDQVSLMWANDSVPSGVLYIAPSVTPFGIMNPSYRVYLIDPKQYTVYDYLTYRTDLMSANKNNHLNYQLGYSVRKHFGLPDLTIDSWWNWAKKLNNSNELVNYRNDVYYGGVDPSYLPSCNQDCLQTLWNSVKNALSP